MDDDRLGELPQQLVRQAGNIAQKVIRELTKGNGFKIQDSSFKG
jgi:hypothetical protein